MAGLNTEKDDGKSRIVIFGFHPIRQSGERENLMADISSLQTMSQTVTNKRTIVDDDNDISRKLCRIG